MASHNAVTAQPTAAKIAANASSARKAAAAARPNRSPTRRVVENCASRASASWMRPLKKGTQRSARQDAAEDETDAEGDQNARQRLFLDPAGERLDRLLALGRQLSIEPLGFVGYAVNRAALDVLQQCAEIRPEGVEIVADGVEIVFASIGLAFGCACFAHALQLLTIDWVPCQDGSTLCRRCGAGLWRLAFRVEHGDAEQHVDLASVLRHGQDEPLDGPDLGVYQINRRSAIEGDFGAFGGGGELRIGRGLRETRMNLVIPAAGRIKLRRFDMFGADQAILEAQRRALDVGQPDQAQQLRYGGGAELLAVGQPAGRRADREPIAGKGVDPGVARRQVAPRRKRTGKGIGHRDPYPLRP